MPGDVSAGAYRSAGAHSSADGRTPTGAQAPGDAPAGTHRQGGACASGVAAGIYNSPKGFGAAVQISSSEGAFDNFSLVADFSGLFTRRCDHPGVKFNYSHNYVFATTEKEGMRYQLYLGPGFTAGWLHDWEKGRWEQTGGTAFRKNYGGMAALSGSAGCRFIFERRLTLDLFWTAEVGIHIRRNEIQETPAISFYLNGIMQSLYPQLLIMYRF